MKNYGFALLMKNVMVTRIEYCLFGISGHLKITHRIALRLHLVISPKEKSSVKLKTFISRHGDRHGIVFLNLQ